MAMSDRRAARRVLGAALTEQTDPAFERRGFRRVSRSLSYRRAVPGGYQRWAFDVELHPDTGGAYLFPAVEVVFPDVVDLARRMLPPGSDSLIHYSLRLTVATFAPPSRRSLIVRDESEAAEVAAWLATMMGGRLGSVVDALATVGGFAETVASGALIEQPMTPVNWVSVAAAYLHLGEPARALAILERHVERSNPVLAGHSRAFLGPRLAAGARTWSPALVALTPYPSA